jgi:hypothetical protein
MGRALLSLNPRHGAYSLLCAAYEARVPFTAHLTIGGDIAHFHPQVDGAALGATSHTDFRLLAELVRRMNGGGVYLNVGSAVTLPEAFLKCVTLVRNLGHELNDITTANLDFIQSYRPLTNVVRRPTANAAGRGYAITGHHELLIPCSRLNWSAAPVNSLQFGSDKLDDPETAHNFCAVQKRDMVRWSGTTCGSVVLPVLV